MARRIDGRGATPAREFMLTQTGRIETDPTSPPDPGSTHAYRKTATILARQINDEVIILTPEGNMYAHPGDYIASDDPPTHLWPVRREVFESTYEQIEQPEAT